MWFPRIPGRYPLTAQPVFPHLTGLPTGAVDSTWTIMVDRDGVEAKRFHGYTSGQTLVYDANGRLLYNGGLTAARGHEGDNAGRRAVIALLNGEARGPLVHNVFGCLLFSADENARLGMGEGS